MKLFIAIAVVLALLAFTRAQDDSNQADSSDPEVAPSDLEEQSSDPEAPSSDEHEPPRPEGPIRHQRPGRPGGRPLGHRIPRSQPDEDQPADNENAEGNPPRGHPQRRPVFDIAVNLGYQNIIRGVRRRATTTTTIAPEWY